MRSPNSAEKTTLSETEKKMLALLVKGASSKQIAESLGYKDGTARVYLSALYKHIGVPNKTSAVTWYLARQTAAADLGRNGVASKTPADTFGERAVATNLLVCLGILEIFLGTHNKLAEASQRSDAANGGSAGSATLRVRRQSRLLWRAMLAGDFALGKQEFDRGQLSELFVDSPGDAVVHASLVILGGYTSSGKKALATLPQRKTATIGITRDERRALLAMVDAVEGKNDHAVGALHLLAAGAKPRPAFRHLLMAALFHLYKARGDVDRARLVAEAIWAEAESVRRQLHALGIRIYSPDNHLPEPPVISRAALGAYLEELPA